MNLCRCEKGHFYDKEKYPTCPHCAGGSASDSGLTGVYEDGPTVPMDGDGGRGDFRSAPEIPSSTPAQMFNQTPVQPAQSFNQAPVQPLQSFNQAAPQPNQPNQSFNPNPQPFVPVMPVARGMSANDITIGADLEDTPTVSMDTPDPWGEEDDDHTVGFFDDVFADADAPKATAKQPSYTAPKASGYAAPVIPVIPVAPRINKVSTPCVGWLVALGGEHIGTDFRLKVGKNFIGRSPKMDIALTDDKSVSRERHAIVVYDPKSNMYLIQPGESSSLAYHNNKLLLTPEKLEAYDMVTVGDVNLLFMPLCSEKFNWGSLLEEMKKKHE